VPEKVVIVGSGQAGVQAAFSLRDFGFEGEITIVGEEPALPYQRPPLSKAYLLGKLGDDGLLLKASERYSEYRVDLRLGAQAEAIDRQGQRLRLRGGEDLPYDHLILATGARLRMLAVPGAALNGVHGLRTVEDARTLQARLDGAKRVVVVGGGFIGLEFAAVARQKGVEVVVVEIAPRVMARVVSTETSRFFQDRHKAWGVEFLFGTGVAAIRGVGSVEGIELTNGISIAADLVLVGIGVFPNSELAETAGLAVDDGVVVDEVMRTSDPSVSAVGDCARAPNLFSALGAIRLESVQNATDQGRCVAARIAGAPKPYDAVPWFWSDQGDLKLQIAGIGVGYDRAAIRGDIAKGAFSVFCFKDGRLVAVESVNRGPDHIMARRLIAAGTRLTPEDAADESRPLKAHLPPAGSSSTTIALTALERSGRHDQVHGPSTPSCERV
jgi:3-phenylpropionate/trans-cinnamate dioxygenase ferredoxin reductase subunit